MSYSFEPGRIYRMPTHFGPAPGPRQAIHGGRYANLDRPQVTTAWLTLQTERDRIAQHLPPGFSPHPDPRLFIEVRNLRELDWLAGRGYNAVHVSFSAVQDATGQAGRMTAIVWESLADPVTTGREELGVPKWFADIPALVMQSEGQRCRASASWDGFRFFELEIEGLSPCGTADQRERLPYIHWRHFPRIGALDQPEAAYVVLAPVENNGRVVASKTSGSGRFRFNRATFEQLPTLHHVVNALAGFEDLGCVGAGIVESVGRSDQRHLAPLVPPAS